MIENIDDYIAEQRLRALIYEYVETEVQLSNQEFDLKYLEVGHEDESVVQRRIARMKAQLEFISKRINYMKVDIVLKQKETKV